MQQGVSHEYILYAFVCAGAVELLIRIKWDGEPSGYAEYPDNLEFSLEMGYIGNLKWKKIL
jgi:hypothetical protein